MTEFTKETEDKIRALGLSLKLQMDFAAAADMAKSEDQLKFSEYNSKSALLMIELIRDLKIKAANDSDYLDEIVALAEQNNSKAAEVLKEQVPKVRGINNDVKNLIAAKKQIQPEDINSIFRKHLKPGI